MVITVLRKELKLLLQGAKMSSCSYYDACKRAYKGFSVWGLIDVVAPIREDTPDDRYCNVT